MEKYKGLAADIIKNVGGEENVISLTHCMTRLRFKLKDENLANKETLEAMDGVMTVVQSGGQYQVVIGNAVKDVYETILEQTAIQGGKDKAEEDSQEVKGSLLDRFIDLISSIFTPILSVLVATGMIKGFTALLLALEVMASERGTAQMLNIIGDAFFYFLPIFLGLSAARKFGMHEFTGMAVAAALVYPTLPTIMNGEKMYTLFAGNC
jgi:PTS system beta-glucosides-specific IIC component